MAGCSSSDENITNSVVDANIERENNNNIGDSYTTTSINTSSNKPVSFVVVSTAEIAKRKIIPGLLSDPSAILVAVSSRSKERARAFVYKHCQCYCDGRSSSSKPGDYDDDTVTGRCTTNSPMCRAMTHDEIFSLSDSGGESNTNTNTNTNAVTDTTTTTTTTKPINIVDVDAFYVPLPSRVRNEYLTKALEHGKHVYSEKPHGGTVNELKAVLDLAASKNLQWMDGTMWYHSNRTKVMEELLFGNNATSNSNEKSRSHSLGKVRRVSASFTWGGGGLVDQRWKEGGNVRTDPARMPMGMLGDSGHYPVSVVAWAFGWELPTKVRAIHTKCNTLGAIVEIEAVLWFRDGGRAVIDSGCELPHRSQFEVVCEKGVLKVDDLVGGQGRTGNFAAYEHPFVGSSSFVVGDHLGKDTIIQVEPCDQLRSLLNEFIRSVQRIRDGGHRANPEWSKRSLCTHTILCAIFESAMRGGVDVELDLLPMTTDEKEGSGGDHDCWIAGPVRRKYVIEGETFEDIPTRHWNKQNTEP